VFDHLIVPNSKRYTFGQLVCPENQTKSIEEEGETRREDVEHAIWDQTAHAGSCLSIANEDSCCQYSYMEASVRAQAQCDVKQNNETVWQEPTCDSQGILGIYEYSRNGRKRGVALAMEFHKLSVNVYAIDSEMNHSEMIFVTCEVEGQTKRLICKHDCIKGKKLLLELEMRGVKFNLNLSQQVKSEAVNMYILALAAKQKAQIVPRFRGWFKCEGRMKFFREEETWNWMEKMCKF